MIPPPGYQHHDGNDPRQFLFKAAVPIGMVEIGRPRGDAHPDQESDGKSGIGQAIEPIGQ